MICQALNELSIDYTFTVATTCGRAFHLPDSRVSCAKSLFHDVYVI